jgi:hypothetical protein
VSTPPDQMERLRTLAGYFNHRALEEVRQDHFESGAVYRQCASDLHETLDLTDEYLADIADLT